MALREGRSARFAVPKRLALYVAGTWAALVVVALIESSNQPAWETRWATVAAVVGGAAWCARWLWFGGWVTVDPGLRVIERRRPAAKHAAEVWTFDDIRQVTTRGGLRADSVRLELGRKRLVFEVGKGEGPVVASMLTDVIQRREPAEPA